MNSETLSDLIYLADSSRSWLGAWSGLFPGCAAPDSSVDPHLLIVVRRGCGWKIYLGIGLQHLIVSWSLYLFVLLLVLVNQAELFIHLDFWDLVSAWLNIFATCGAGLNSRGLDCYILTSVIVWGLLTWESVRFGNSCVLLLVGQANKIIFTLLCEA